MSKHLQNLFANKQQNTAKAMNGIIIGMDIDQFAQLQATAKYCHYSFSEFKDLVFKQLRMFNDLCLINFMESDTAFIIQLQTTITSAQQGWDDHAQHWFQVADDYHAKLKAEGKIDDDYVLLTGDLRHLHFGRKDNSSPRFLYDKVLRRLVASKALDFDTYAKRIQALEKRGQASLQNWATKFYLTQFKAIGEAPYYQISN